MSIQDESTYLIGFSYFTKDSLNSIKGFDICSNFDIGQMEYQRDVSAVMNHVVMTCSALSKSTVSIARAFFYLSE